MKKILFLVGLTSILFSCKKEAKIDVVKEDLVEIQSQWNDFGFSENVKSTEEYTTAENREETTTSSFVRKFENQFKPDVALQFDENGKLISKVSYKEDGNVAEEIIYDGKDKIISIKNYSSDKEYLESKFTWDGDKNKIITRRFNGLKTLDKEVFLYENGKKIEKQKYDDRQNLVDKTGYKYNDKNQISEELYFNGKPVIQSRLLIEYDDNGNKITETYYDKDSKIISKTTSVYNSSNQLLNSKTVTSDGTLDTELFRTYDDKNRLIAKGSFEQFDNSNNKDVFEYDANDNTTSWKVYKNEKLVASTSYKYDVKNNLVLELVTSPEGKELSKKTIEYTYDENSNWITRKTTLDKLVLLTSRKIEFHK